MVATYGGWHRRLVRAGVGAAMVTVVVGCSSGGGTPTAAGGSGTPAGTATGTGTTASGTPTAAATSGGPAPRATATPTPAPIPRTATASPDGNQRPVLNNLPGDAATGSCVNVADQRDVRSGTMGAGNFVTARKQFSDQAKTRSQPSVSLYLIPSDARGLTTVTVKLRNTRDGTTRTVSSDERQLAEDWLYFPVTLSVPSAGSWEITATAGGNTGCFRVSFG